MFFEKLGGEIYVLVSEFQNYPCIGIRKCLFIKKTGKIIVGKEGVNLIVPQYRNLKLYFDRLISTINKENPMTADLGYGCSVEINKSTCFQVKIERKDKSILLSKIMLQNLGEKFDDIDLKIDQLFKKIHEGELIYIFLQILLKLCIYYRKSNR